MRRQKRSTIQLPIEVHIEELVLNGFESGDRYAVADAVQHELARLLTAQGMSSESSGDYNTIDAGAFEVRDGDGGASVGAQVAQAVYQGLSGNDSSMASTHQPGPTNNKP